MWINKQWKLKLCVGIEYKQTETLLCNPWWKFPTTFTDAFGTQILGKSETIELRRYQNNLEKMNLL